MKIKQWIIDLTKLILEPHEDLEILVGEKWIDREWEENTIEINKIGTSGDFVKVLSWPSLEFKIFHVDALRRQYKKFIK